MEKKISFSEILKKYTMVIVLVFVVIMFSVNTKGVMLLPQNVNNLVAQNAYVFILATGMLFCILTGGNIDLSVGSVVCFVAAVGGKMMVLNSMNPYLTMIVMLLVGIAIGAWQGFWIAYVRIPPFIVTLAGMLAFRGLSNVVLEGQTLAPMPDAYLALFNNYIPDFLGGGEGFNRTCFVVGIIVCIVYVALVMKNRADRAFFLFFQIFFDPPGCDPTHCRITQFQEICRSFQSFQMLFQKYGGSLFYSYGLKCSQTELKTFV